jgi:hypothetical protein
MQRCTVSVQQFPEAMQRCPGSIELSKTVLSRRFKASHPFHKQWVASLRCRGGLRPPIPTLK